MHSRRPRSGLIAALCVSAALMGASARAFGGAQQGAVTARLTLSVLGGVTGPARATERASASERIVLRDGAYAFSICPATLAAAYEQDGARPLTISAPQSGLGTVSQLRHGRREACWRLPSHSLTVEFRIGAGVLAGRFRADRPGRFTWPVLEPGESARAYILPLFEGSYVPVDDSAWGEFLDRRSPMNTTGDLTMPFWGVDCGRHTLTYLLTNPFNNELAFHPAEGRIELRLTHEFPPNQDGGEFGVDIAVGGPSPVEPARQYRRRLIGRGEFVSMRQKIKRVPDARKLLGAAHVYLWGDGVSPEMMDSFARAGLDRLWLGLPAWQPGLERPEAIRRAQELGYLVGVYDSFHSIHHPDEPDTWPTAQFDLKLYQTGAVVGPDGEKLAGFQGKGYLLSPIAARPYVESRVQRVMDAFAVRPGSWFIDCDAAGALHDDYSELHPATQADGMRARLERMAWVRDTFGVVIGSELGSAYAASVIHFAHGMMTPVFGWTYGRIRRDRTSPYFLGPWWPPEGPARFLRQVPLKPEYRAFFFDPRSRLPLYQVAFHDSVVTTHHWEYASLKFVDQVDTVELLEQLYNVPPLYHVNRREFAKHRDRMQAHHAFFSPLHRELALVPMTDFAWLTPDRLVHRTTFGDAAEIVANFRQEPFQWGEFTVPARSAAALRSGSGEVAVFTPLP